MAITVTALQTLTSAGTASNAVANTMKGEIQTIEWGSASDTTASVTTTLTKIYGMATLNMGTGIAAANNYNVFIAQAVDSTQKCIVVSSNTVSIKRSLTDAAGTLIASASTVILWGV